MSDVVLAATDRPVPLVVRRIEDERVPDGLIGIGSYLNEALIARCAVPPDVAGFFEEKKRFVGPVRPRVAPPAGGPRAQRPLFWFGGVGSPLFWGGRERGGA